MCQDDDPAIIISVGPANTHDRSISREFSCYLHKNLPEGIVLREHVWRPGAIIASPIDIHELIADASAIVTIAGFFWGLYIRFVEKRRQGTGQGFLLTSILVNRKHVWFQKIGEDITSEEQLQESLIVFQQSINSQDRTSSNKPT
ncbi:MAG: hypothetical protein ACYC7E_16100 [Armatimonadota bacterium]